VSFLVRGQRLAGRRGWRMALDVAVALALCGGLSWHLARAVAAGLWGGVGSFVRTPKTGESDVSPRRGARIGENGPRGGHPEIIFSGIFLAVAIWAAVTAHPAAVPFLVMLSAGLGWVGATARLAAR